MKPIILLIFADPANDLRAVKEEYWGVMEVLKPTQERGLCEVLPLYPARPQDVLEAFRTHRNRVAIVHYAGHASPEALFLEQSGGVSADGLAEFLAQQQGLQLVFLNGCRTQGQVEALQAAGVLRVIATEVSVEDGVASRLAAAFYQSLVNGLDIEKSYLEAVATVKTLKGESTQPRDFWVETAPQDRWPWGLFVQAGSPDWNLLEAADNPLLGIPELPKEIRWPAKPYPDYLTRFTRAEARIFCGRGREVRSLYDSLHNPEAPPIVLLYGQSGVGKSSLLEAGLLPRLEADFEVRMARRDQGLGLLGTLQQLLGGELEPSWKTLERNRPAVMILDQLEEAYTRPASSGPTEETARFFDALTQLYSKPESWPKGKLLLSFRKEWFPEIKSELDRRNLLYHEEFLQALDEQGIAEAIRGPTRNDPYGLSIRESDLPQQIALDLLKDPNSPIAPTLQILLSRMWLAVENQPERVLTRDLYAQLARQGFGLDQFLEGQLGKLEQNLKPPLQDAVKAGLALDVLEYHTTELGTATARAEEDLRQRYAQDLGPLLYEGKNLYLLSDVGEGRADGAGATRLAHDTLAPLVRKRFVESELVGQRSRRILDSRTRDWRDGEAAPTLDARDLELVEAGEGGTRVWNEKERRLVEASRAARDEAKRRERSRRYWQLIGIAALLGLVVLMGGFALYANLQTKIATARLYIAQANPLSHEAYDLAVLLYLEANRIWDSDETRVQLREMLFNDRRTNPRATAYLSPDISAEDKISYEVKGLAFSPDGKTVAVAMRKGQIVLWDIPTRTYTSPDGMEFSKEGILGREVDKVIFSPDLEGRYLVAGGWDSSIAIWEKVDNRYQKKCLGEKLTEPVSNAEKHVVDLQISWPEGNGDLAEARVVSGHRNGAVSVWDFNCARLYSDTLVPGVTIKATAFSSDNHNISAVFDNKELLCMENNPPWKVEVRKLEFNSSIATLPINGTTGATTSMAVGRAIISAAFAPETRELTVGMAGETVYFKQQGNSCSWKQTQSRSSGSHVLAYDVSGNKLARKLQGCLEVKVGAVRSVPIAVPFADQVSSLALSPDGATLAAGDSLGQIFLFDTSLDFNSPVVPADSALLKLMRERACRMANERSFTKLEAPLLDAQSYQRNCPTP